MQRLMRHETDFLTRGWKKGKREKGKREKGKRAYLDACGDEG